MMMTDRNDDILEDIFAQARAVAPTPSDDLIARVMAGVPVPQVASQPAPRRSLGQQVLDILGGWTAVSGLVTATCAGVWIGVSPPESVQDYTATYFGDEISVSLFSEEAIFATGDFFDG
ncbi:hypothetical protein [Yoonia sp. I 8.24]|uniref:hypothetical protein n=1 Tax=Yoonia sp. I 8.24 TaxID=1537229 RepID=UPI001EDD36BE|nr:hypothetical protein [Yoonia sp. I 8.24]MCG3268987.1 hypothetical protein [Yoonia sp. I 8.24]